jgi:hypothetical protein
MMLEIAAESTGVEEESAATHEASTVTFLKWQLVGVPN